MTTALDMCHAARRAWERSQPQYVLDLDALEEPVAGDLSSSESPSDGSSSPSEEE